MKRTFSRFAFVGLLPALLWGTLALNATRISTAQPAPRIAQTDEAHEYAGRYAFANNAQPAVETPVAFDRREEMIRMRDGAHLHTLIFTPKTQKDALPFLMNRTPYGIGENNSDSINRRYRDFVPDGYIFVLQDIRGRYGSEGQFMMNRPMRTKKDKKSIDEST